MDERKWMQAIQKGNKKPLRDIAEKYYADVYRFCAFQTGNREDAYDLAQETFLRFIRYLDKYHDRNLKGYLLTIAMNLCRDYHRKKAMEAAMLTPRPYEEGRQESSGYAFGEGDRGDEAVAAHSSGWQLTPEQQMLRRDAGDRLLDAMKNLPDIQREAILLHYFHDLKYREIARLTGCQVSTVKSRIRQGTEKLGKLLNKEDFFDE